MLSNYGAPFTHHKSSFLPPGLRYLGSTYFIPRVVPGRAGSDITRENTGSYGSLQKGDLTKSQEGVSGGSNDKAET